MKDTIIYKKGETLYSIYAINNYYNLSARSGYYYSQIHIEYFKKCFSFNDTSVSLDDIPKSNFE